MGGKKEFDSYSLLVEDSFRSIKDQSSAILGYKVMSLATSKLRDNNKEFDVSCTLIDIPFTDVGGQITYEYGALSCFSCFALLKLTLYLCNQTFLL